MNAQSKKNKLLSCVASEVIKYLPITEIIEMYNVGHPNWKGVFENAKDADKVELFANAAAEAGMTDLELDSLFEPFIAREIQTALNNSGSKTKVTIRW